MEVLTLDEAALYLALFSLKQKREGTLGLLCQTEVTLFHGEQA